MGTIERKARQKEELKALILKAGRKVVCENGHRANHYQKHR